MKLLDDRLDADAVRPYWFRPVGGTGCEILSPDGKVIAWAVNPSVAAIIVGLLNKTEANGLGL